MERAYPFFHLLEKQVYFEWTKECERAFHELKKAISLVLVREDQKQQKPIYYVSKALQGVEFRYYKIEKLVFA